MGKNSNIGHVSEINSSSEADGLNYNTLILCFTQKFEREVEGKEKKKFEFRIKLKPNLMYCI